MRQVFNQINARKLHGQQGVCSGIMDNNYFVVISAIELLLQVLIVQVLCSHTPYSCPCMLAPGPSDMPLCHTSISNVQLLRARAFAVGVCVRASVAVCGTPARVLTREQRDLHTAMGGASALIHIDTLFGTDATRVHARAHALALSLSLSRECMQVPGLNTAMGCVKLKPREWCVCMVIGATSLPVNVALAFLPLDWFHLRRPGALQARTDADADDMDADGVPLLVRRPCHQLHPPSP